MMRSIVSPKHTLLSVVRDLEEGLNDETVYLNDKELIEAGYEIHEFQERWYSLGLLLFAASVFAYPLLLVPPVLPEKSIFMLLSGDLLFNVAASLLYALALYGLGLYLGYRRREKGL